jgi:hypothetical protein
LGSNKVHEVSPEGPVTPEVLKKSVVLTAQEAVRLAYGGNESVPTQETYLEGLRESVAGQNNRVAEGHTNHSEIRVSNEAASLEPDSVKRHAHQIGSFLEHLRGQELVQDARYN